MPKVCREGDDLSTGHLCDSTTTLDTPGQRTVYANNILVARKTDKTVSHNIPAPLCVPHIAQVNVGSSNVYVVGLAVARVGDSTDAGEMTKGSPDVYANGN